MISEILTCAYSSSFIHTSTIYFFPSWVANRLQMSATPHNTLLSRWKKKQKNLALYTYGPALNKKKSKTINSSFGSINFHRLLMCVWCVCICYWWSVFFWVYNKYTKFLVLIQFLLAFLNNKKMVWKIIIKK